MKLPEAHHEEVMDRANPEEGDKRSRLSVREVREWVRDLTTHEVKSPVRGDAKTSPSKKPRAGGIVRAAKLACSRCWGGLEGLPEAIRRPGQDRTTVAKTGRLEVQIGEFLHAAFPLF